MVTKGTNMDTLVGNANESLILKKVKISPETEDRIKKYRIKKIADTGSIVNVNDTLAEIIERGLEAGGFPAQSVA
jgi:hypothetical protein